MWTDKGHRACIVTFSLGKHIWREATDYEDPHWPPSWLSAATWLVALLVFVNVGFGPITSILRAVVDRADSGSWDRVVETPLRAYIDHHSAGLPPSPRRVDTDVALGRCHFVRGRVFW